MLGAAIAFEDRSAVEARGFVGADLGFTKGRYAFSARGDVGLSTAGALTVDLSSGLRIAF